MFIETSAVVEILLNRPRARDCSLAIAAAKTRYTSAFTRLEACMVLSTRLNIEPSQAGALFDDFLDAAEVRILDFDDAMSRLSVSAFENYGKGRNKPGSLNLGDCISYASAKGQNLPMLFVGKDFSETDIESVLQDPAPAL